MLVKFSDLIRSLVVDEGRMAANLEGTNGLVFSQAVLLALVEGGLARDEAYRIVQRNAMDAWEGNKHLQSLLLDDDAVPLSSTELDECFSLERVSDSAKIVFVRLSNLEIR